MPADVAQIPPAVRSALEQGADALLKDDPVAAIAAFERAVTLNRAATVDGFISVWARRLPQQFTRTLARRYPSLDRVRIDETDWIDLEEMSRMADEVGDGDAQWQLGVYTLAADTDAGNSDGRKQVDALRALLRKAGELERNPAQAGWLSLRFLKQYNPLTAGPADGEALNDASVLFKSGMRHLDVPDSLNAFAELASLADTNGNWAWPLVDDVVARAQREGADSIVLELAWRLASDERKDRLQRSLALVQDVERMTGARPLSDAKRAEWSANILYVRATASAGLERLGVSRIEDAEPLLRRLQLSPREDLRREAAFSLAQLLIDHERYGEGDAVVADAQKEWPYFSSPVGAQLKGYFRRGDTAGVATIARVAAKKAQEAPDDDRLGWLYLDAIASILAKEPQWESAVERYLARTQDYHDYVRMIALAYAGGASPRLGRALEKRFPELEPSTWPGRLRNGDPSAWREMLLGRFKDMAASDAILTTVTNHAAFERSDFAQLPMSEVGLQCEAWFYDAMVARARGQNERMLESLRRTVGTGFTAYYEYAMAKYLLAHPD